MAAEHGCPSPDLGSTSALEAMLKARTNAHRQLVLMTAGYTEGNTAIQMHMEVEKFVAAQIEHLGRYQHGNYLVLSADYKPRPKSPWWAARGLCDKRLRAVGICCAWSRYGIDALEGASNASSRGWQVEVDHPWILFLQRSWFVAEAAARGVSVLSMDTDLHFASSPFAFVNRWRPMGELLFQGDSGFPMRHVGHTEPEWDQRKLASEAATAMPHEVPVRCASTPHPASECACGPTAAPIVNVGLVWASGVPAVARIFNWTAQIIVKRLRAEPTRDAAGVVIDFKIWEQDVMNEALHRFARPPSALQRLARVPSSGSGDCHPMDADCREFPTPTRPNSHGQRITARWWLPSARNRSVWLASAARRDGSCDASEHLIAHTEIGEGVRAVVVPQSAAGRVCGQRKVVLDDLRDAIEASREAARGHGHAREGGGHGHDTADAADGRAHGRAMAPLPCSAYRQPAFLLDQEVLHAQFTNYFTRQHIFYALHWWRHEKSNEKSHAHPNASAPTSERHANTSAAACAVHQNGTLGVMLGSSVADHALLCAPPEANPNVTCPCCWRPPPAYDYRTRALVRCPHWNPNW